MVLRLSNKGDIYTLLSSNKEEKCQIKVGNQEKFQRLAWEIRNADV